MGKGGEGRGGVGKGGKGRGKGRREVLFPRGSERISQWSEDTLSPAQEGGGEGNQMRTASEYSDAVRWECPLQPE